VTRSDAPKTSEANLSIVVVADAAMRLRCQTILARQRIASRGASLAGARRVLRSYRPRVLLLDAARSPRRALGALPTLKRLSPDNWHRRHSNLHGDPRVTRLRAGNLVRLHI